MTIRTALLLAAGAAALAAAAAAGPALAETAADAPVEANRRTDVQEGDVVLIQVISPKNQAAAVAPTKSSLSAASPQSIIDRAFIEQETPQIGDYTTTAAFAPSMVSAGNANGPGSTDGAKLSLRGVADGSFNITYDGIPWGDTNGPSHHANSFFPNSTIGGVIVDRSPGTALDIGQASFGGSVNLFSLPLEDQLGARQKVTFGSWQTWQSVTTVFTGPIAELHGLNVLMNFQEYGTKGYLTYSPAEGANQYVKASLPLTDKITVTGLYTRNDDDYYLSDIGTGTIAEIEKLGAKNFGLCNDPNYSCYQFYNYTKKMTDFEYLREAGEIAHNLSFENTTYSYWYTNKTLSANTQDWSSAYGTAKGPTVELTPPATYPANGKASAGPLVPGIPGYLKRNEYRVTGDVVRFNYDTPLGRLTVGGLYEVAKTKRFIVDVAEPVPGSGIVGTTTPIYNIEKAATLPVIPPVPGCYGYPTLGAAYKGICQTPLNIRYNEYSGWHYYQAFGQWALKLTDRLTVTPGVKYINYDLYVHAPVEQTVTQPVYVDKTYEKTLGFLTANYRLKPFWSVYGQVSQGFLVPNISSLYVQNQNYQSIKPQESMAYQIGTVFSRGRINFDVDAYDIVFSHKLQSNVDFASGDTYFTNSGGADYRGVEGEATVVVLPTLSSFVNGSVNQAEGKSDAINPGGNGKQLALAPRWTAAAGLRFEHRHNLFGDDDVILILDSKWVGPQMAIAAAGTAAPTGLIKTWSQADFSATYRFGQFAIEGQILNLFDHQYLTGGKFKALVPGTDQLALSSAAGGAANTPQYLTPRSFQITLKAAF